MADGRDAGSSQVRTALRIAMHIDGRRIRGSERQLLYLAADLRARGHELHVSSVKGTEVAAAFRELGARVSGARPRGDVDLLSLARYVRWLRGVRPDAVLLTSWKRAALSALGARLARVPRVLLRVGGPHDWRGGAGDRLRRHALRHWIDALWTNSDPLASRLATYAGGRPRGGIHVVPNAVEVADVEPFPLRAALGVGADEALVITASGLERNKGHDVLLAAIARLPVRVHLAIVGDGPERGALARQAGSLAIVERVHFLGHRNDVPALLPAADAFALATRADSTPNALLEAMAAGIPAVITDVPGSEVLLAAAHLEPRGWVVPCDDAEALASALTAALGREGAVRALRARAHVSREHTRAALVARVEGLLRAP